MVGLARFELTTSCTPCKRSTRLNYSPTYSCSAPRTGPKLGFGVIGTGKDSGCSPSDLQPGVFGDFCWPQIKLSVRSTA